jgi:uncharacterized delta-60 repeat protein
MKKLITTVLVVASSFAMQAQNFFTEGLFGNNGHAYSPVLGGGDSHSSSIFKLDDGKILICGFIYESNCNCLYNVMFRTDECGNIDSSFGTNGLVRHTFDQRNAGYAYTVLDNGKIIAVGMQSDGNAGSQQFPFIGRYTSAGIPDSSFATNGTNKISNLGPQAFTSVYQLDSGKFLCTNGTLLMRFDSLGFQDPTFGTNGVISYPIPPGVNFFYDFRSVKRSDGKIISVAAAYSGVNNDKNPAYFCYDTDGLLDSTFGVNGFYKEQNLVISNQVPLMFVQSDDKLVTAQPVTANDIALARYNTDGSIDSTFGTNGYTIVTGSDVRLEYISNFPDNSFIIGYSQNGVPSEFHKYTSDGIAVTVFSLDGGNNFQFPTNSHEKADIGLALSNDEFIMGSTYAFSSGSMALKIYNTVSSTPGITQNNDSLFANVSNPNATLQWYLDGTILTGETNDLLVTTQNGSYVVEVTNANGCTGTDTIQVTNTGIADLSNKNLVSIYPNPINDVLFINNYSASTVEVSIFDLNGKMILKSAVANGINKMDVSTLTAGVYMIETKAGENTSRQRLVKK